MGKTIKSACQISQFNTLVLRSRTELRIKLLPLTVSWSICVARRSNFSPVTMATGNGVTSDVTLPNTVRATLPARGLRSRRTPHRNTGRFTSYWRRGQRSYCARMQSAPGWISAALLDKDRLSSTEINISFLQYIYTLYLGITFLKNQNLRDIQVAGRECKTKL